VHRARSWLLTPDSAVIQSDWDWVVPSEMNGLRTHTHTAEAEPKEGPSSWAGWLAGGLAGWLVG